MTPAETHLQKEPIVIYRTDGRFRLVATECGLASEGEDLAAAYANLRQLITEKAPEGPTRSGVTGEPRGFERERLTPAAAGMARLLQAALLMLILSVLPLMFFAASALSNAAGLLGQVKSAAAFIAPTGGEDKAADAAHAQEKRRVIVRALHTIAQNARALTPERKKEVLEDVRTIVRAAQPFADAVRPLFTGESSDDQTLKAGQRDDPKSAK